MRGKKIRAMLALLLGVSMLAGCAGKEESGDATYTYNFTQPSTPNTFNFHDSDIVDYITMYTEINMWELILNSTLGRLRMEL